MNRFVDDLLQVCDLLSTEIVEGETRGKLGHWGGASEVSPGIAADAPMWSQFGFASRPAEPDEDGAPMVIYYLDGNQKRIVSTRDLRMAPKLPALKAGETCIFGFSGQFIRMFDDGGISIFTTDDNTTDGRTISLSVWPDEGLVFNSPWGKVSFGPMGFHVNHYSGGRIDLGALGGLPFPMNLLTSYFSASANTANLSGVVTALGSDAGIANTTAITALLTLLTAIVGVFSTATPASGMSGAAAVLAPLLAAYTPVALDIGKVG
jgi:hypothetical protein